MQFLTIFFFFFFQLTPCPQKKKIQSSEYILKLGNLCFKPGVSNVLWVGKDNRSIAVFTGGKIYSDVKVIGAIKCKILE
mgnify:CR=1 FL=1